MVSIEKAFPRGGIMNKTLTESNVFGVRQVKKPVEKSKNKLEENEKTEKEGIRAISADLINYKTIQEEMIIMGVVERINLISLSVSLPGRLVGEVTVSSISESYTEILNKYVASTEKPENFKKLDELYCQGQIVCTKVVSITNNEKNGKLKFELSLRPSDVNKHFHREDLRKGMVINGAVKEIQEYGCIIETGINELRCFLPKEKMLKENLSIGEVICVQIESITKDSLVSTAKCKMINPEKRKIKDIIEPKLDYIIPSSIVRFTITKILKNGLQGTLMNDSFMGYINEYHLGGLKVNSKKFKVNSTISAHVLYVMPLTKLVYLSLNLVDKKSQSSILKHGNIIDKARIDYVNSGGIVLSLENEEVTGKGLLPFALIKSNFIGNYDQDEVLTKYKSGNHLKVRILTYHVMDSIYICSNDKNVINEKYFSISDLKPGDIVNATIVDMDRWGGYNVQVGKVKGSLEKLFLSSSKCFEKESNILCRVMTTDAMRNKVYLTNLDEYMKPNAVLLTEMSQIKENRLFLGTVVKTGPIFNLVRFFNNIKAICYHKIDNNAEKFLREGQTRLFAIVSHDSENIVVKLMEENYKIGSIYTGKVNRITQEGLDINLFENAANKKVLVPVKLLSDFPELAMTSACIFEAKQEVKMMCVSQNAFSIRDFIEYEKHKGYFKSWKDIQIGDILRAFVKEVQGNVILIQIPIQSLKEKTFKIHAEMFLSNPQIAHNIMLYPDQVIYVKVLSKDVIQKNLTLSAKLSDVLGRNAASTVEYFTKYIENIELIKNGLIRQGKSIGSVNIGERYSVKVMSFNKKTGDFSVKFPNGADGLIKRSFFQKNMDHLEIGQTIECIAIWIDYVNNFVYCSHKLFHLNHIMPGNKLPDDFAKKSELRATVLLKLEDVILCSFRNGKGPLIWVPKKLHYNDFEGTVGKEVHENMNIKLSFIHDEYPLAIFDKLLKILQELPNRKRKSEDKELSKRVTKRIKHANFNILQENSLSESKTFCKKRKYDEDDDDEMEVLENCEHDARKHKIQQTEENEFEPILPGALNFWSAETGADILKLENESSEENNDNDGNTQEDARSSKRKKLTAKERFKKQKEEEERIRVIEEKLTNPNSGPDTVDEFDRLVLSEPDNSRNWINYMVFHLQATEIDKAKAIARKALKTISFREEDELINVWVALLNLELRYGTKDSFMDTLKESLLYNNTYKIYTKVIEILVGAKKVQELVDIVHTVTKKFKGKPEIWKICAMAYFNLEMLEKGKQLLHKALALLPERDHVSTIVSFANLHKKFGDNDTAYTLLEQVITSYPKRVDVWSQYVDMLIKDKDMKSARRVFERAVVQKIQMKKMRVIFKKYIEFEEKYGTKENVNKVKELAANYVSNELNENNGN